MKRFLLFSGVDYYPKGGFWDFKGAFETVAEAEVIGRIDCWFQVVDRETLGVVSRSGASCYGEPGDFDTPVKSEPQTLTLK